MPKLNMDKVKLFCLPFAGGSSYSYARFPMHLSGNITLTPCELPGRGARMQEPPLVSMEAIVEDAAGQIMPHLEQGEHYGFYGHSMGALTAWLVTEKLVKEGFHPPRHLYLSSRRAPVIPCKLENVHLLEKNRFLKRVIGFGGIPQEVLGETELIDLFLPILRADFQAIETHRYTRNGAQDIPVTVMIGTRDSVTREEAEAWQGLTAGNFCLLTFEGGHFFINDHVEDICRIISKGLA